MNPDDAAMKELDRLKRTYYRQGQYDVERRQTKRPVWMRRGFWILALKRMKSIKHADVDKFEFDRAFPS